MDTELPERVAQPTKYYKHKSLRGKPDLKAIDLRISCPPACNSPAGSVFSLPSVYVDTACSSSMVALDLACKSLHVGDASAAVVVGSSLMLSPETSLNLSNMNFLSQDGICHSFDHRASGYGRAEGIIAIVLKPLAQALEDGDMIRAIIRATGSNQDGHTPGITQPSAEAQETLIRRVYERAGLKFDYTRYVEAHGTGTLIGDPIEMKAIGRVFRNSDSQEEPLYVGSIKSNIGHLEGGSGLAGVLKAILMLEKGYIAPNALFEEINPRIDAEFFHTIVPTQCVPWPAREIRRVSVNSFGLGGTNSHVILDDALRYLNDHDLTGNHKTSSLTDNFQEAGKSVCNGDSQSEVQEHHAYPKVNGTRTPNEVVKAGMNGVPSNLEFQESILSKSTHRLLVWSAADRGALSRMMQSYEEYYRSSINGNLQSLHALSYTLSERRSHLPWRTFAVATSSDMSLTASKFIRASDEVELGFIFTGQGAQYAGMGIELLCYPVFKETLLRAESAFRRLGCPWSLIDELQNDRNINHPEYSQPSCTALQLALVELLKSFGVAPRVVVGHSSGEIAAAYTVGALSLDSACRVAYYRGLLAGQLRRTGPPGVMMSVNLSESNVAGYLANKLESSVSQGSVHISCVNSPGNCTISGKEDIIDEVKRCLDQDQIFAQKIKTGVAYHSPAMTVVSKLYVELMGCLETSGDTETDILMISSVTGKVISPSTLCTAQYWADNLTSTVRFSDAATELMQQSISAFERRTVTDLIEVGPHSALRRPMLDVLKQQETKSQNQVTYHSVLSKPKSAIETTMALVGQLFCKCYPVSIKAANQQTGSDHDRPAFMVDCPSYPFDHSRKYWFESRFSRDYRLRKHTGAYLLGKQAYDWNPLEPKWRNILSLSSMPWLGDHVVSDTVLLPGMGMLSMAIEALIQMSDEQRQVSGYYFRDASFLSPVTIGNTDGNEDETETVLQAQPIRKEYEKESSSFQIKLFSYRGRTCTECFKATAEILYVEGATQVDSGKEARLEQASIISRYQDIVRSAQSTVSSDSFYKYSSNAGIRYGKSFQLLEDIRWDDKGAAVAHIDLGKVDQLDGLKSVAHPALLDAIIHLMMVPLSKGLSEQSDTLIPHKLLNTWISADRWRSHQTTSIEALSILKSEPMRSGASTTTFALADDGALLFSIGELMMATVSHNEPTTAKKMPLYGIEWRPQLSLLGSTQLKEIIQSMSSRSDARTPPNAQVLANGNRRRAEDDQHDMVESIHQLDRALLLAMRKVLANVTNIDLSSSPSHIQKFIDSLKYYNQMSTRSDDKIVEHDDLEAALLGCEKIIPSWGLFPAIARNLENIIRGDADPLDLVFSTNLAADFYSSIFARVCDGRFHNYLDLLTHENPALKILEVGAGTGGLTSHVLTILGEIEKRTGSTRFSSYTFTDLSPTFFENAKERFIEFQDRMDFWRFDVSDTRQPEGGIKYGEYDVVIAGSVLHITADLKATVRNIHKLLKPGGKLLNLEFVVPSSPFACVGFGVIPTWWLSADKWRQHSPLVTEDTWDAVLRDCGFSGNDLVIRDFDDEVCHISSMIASTATIDATPPKPRCVAVIDETVANQVFLATIMRHKGLCADIYTLEGFHAAVISDNDVVVSLIEIGKSVLATVSSTIFSHLKIMVQKASNLLWVASSRVGDQPTNHIMTGFVRSLRSEAFDKRLVTLNIELRSEDAMGDCVKYIDAVIDAVFAGPSPEIEFMVQDGCLSTCRVVKDVESTEAMHSLLYPQRENSPWEAGPPLVLSVGTPGLLDTLEFRDDTDYCESPLAADEIEVEAKAWALSFRDVFIAAGRLPDENMGFECAGIVTRVSSANTSCLGGAEEIRPGDRVVLCAPGCMRMYPRSSVDMVYRIPDSLSFEDAVAAVNPGITAYHALVNLARLAQGEKILIHSASGSTGQMAVWIAKMLGAEVYATVGFDEKKDFLTQSPFNIPSEHIFYSRNNSFAKGIMRVTNGYGVDVVLNSLSGSALQASWDCIAPYGRFVEMGKADIAANSSLPMSGFKKNVSFMAIDLHHISISNPRLMRTLLLAVKDLIAGGVIHNPAPIYTYSVSDTEKAFRSMQSGRNMGRIILTTPRDETKTIVPKLLRRRSFWKFSNDASYLVAGGFGGLGRAIVRWMVFKGVKYLMLPSRSGASSAAALALLDELRAAGVQVAYWACDVSSSSSLAAFLQSCASDMPSIKGCINATMDLQDGIFENMTHDQWQRTIRSKVDTSWNLHQLLPRNLDFFILLSSLSGIYGSIAQSNYAGGCTYQDALAWHRAACGNGNDNCLSIDIGWMRTIGIVAENEEYQRNRVNARDMAPIEEQEFLALLDLACNPRRCPDSPKRQIMIGAITHADFAARGEQPITQVQVPLFAGFSRLLDGAGERGSSKAKGDEEDFASQFRDAPSTERRTAVFLRALVGKLARALAIASEEIDVRKPLSNYGVDSLMAVELRNWIGQDFRANVAVFDIMGGRAMTAVADLVTEKTEVVN
ncbi:fatty acid synthase S-acetyltransferase [Xylariaceae sp. FL1019]|nr:fatty acid synthase S-acetyltransferase [Xylariaceae sp. FL1019]